jgi:hypothetical protein
MIKKKDYTNTAWFLETFRDSPLPNAQQTVEQIVELTGIQLLN